MDVSVIIVNYNTLQMTSDCVDSIFEMTRGISFEVILIDNASTDGSKDHFCKDNRIIYQYSDVNLGFGKANNKGVDIAKGRNVVFLNPDTILINNALKILSDYLDSREKVGACGGNLYDGSGHPVISFERCFPSILSEVDRCLKGYLFKIIFGRNYKFNHTDKVLNVAYIVGADLMVKKSILNDIGAFDKRFFMYYEEVELCKRIFDSGYKIVNVPSAMITHLEGQSSKETDRVTRLIKGEKMRLAGRKVYFDVVHGRLYHKFANAFRRLYFLSRLMAVKDSESRQILQTTLHNFKELYK